MPAPVLLPRPDAPAERSPTSDAFFDELGIRTRRATYEPWLGICAASLAAGVMPASRRELVELAGRDYDNHSSVYKALDLTDAHRARADTAAHRRSSLMWAGRQAPMFAAVHAVEHDDALVVKAGLALTAGVLPFALASTRHADDPMQAVWADIGMLGRPVTLVCAVEDPLTLETLLAASTIMSFDCFAAVDPFYLPGPGAPVRLQWGGPAEADELIFADVLQRIGTPVGGSRSFAHHVRVHARAHRAGSGAEYLVHGPSPTGRYWMQRRLGTWRETTDALRTRARALDRLEITLASWVAERLRIRKSSISSAERLEHIFALASMFALHSGFWPRPGPQLDAWLTACRAWRHDESEQRHGDRRL